MSQSQGSPSDFSSIDRLCDCFESALRTGERPAAEDYLLEVPEQTRARLLTELFQLECAYSQTDAAAILDDYCTRFPQYAEVLQTAMRSVRSAAESCSGHAFCETAAYPSTELRQKTQQGAGSRRTLGCIWPMSELPRDVVCAVADAMHEEEYAAGAALIRQGEPPSRLLVLVEGDTEIHVENCDCVQVVFRAAAPCVLGEMGILSGGKCTATIVARSPVRALSLPVESLHRLAARYPVLLPAIGRLVAERLGQDQFDALAGKVLQDYRVKRCIGRGGMAMVYLATDLRRGQDVALKMMSHRFIGQPEALTRFEREFEICRDLRHIHIAHVYDHFTAFGTHFIVMEYCPGQTLRDFIQCSAPLPEVVVRKVAGQLAQAISYAHDLGVVHRDIKPSNIMIRDDGLLKLMDFGLAKSRSMYSSDLTSEGQVLGTIRYMPLEQIEGDQVDQRVDVFAFGCIVYELLTGRYFLEGDSFLEVLSAHERVSLPPPESLRGGMAGDLYRVLQQSLQKAAHDRVLDLKAVGAWAGKVDKAELGSPAEAQMRSFGGPAR